MKRDEERSLIQKYHQRFMKASEGMEERNKILTIIDQFDRGEQWKDQSIPPWVPKPVTNYIRYIRTLKRANLASAIPKSHISAKIEEMAPYVERLKQAYSHVWEESKVPLVVRKCIDRTILQNVAVAYVYIDDTATDGVYYGPEDPRNMLYKGALKIKRFPITRFFVDPDAYEIDDAKYCEITIPASLSQTKENPKYKEYAGVKLEQLKFSHIHSDEEAGDDFEREVKLSENGQPIEGDEMIVIHRHFERYYKAGKWHLDISDYVEGTDFFLFRTEDAKPAEYPFAILYDEEDENDFRGVSTAAGILENQKVINKTAQIAAIIAALRQNPQKVVSKASGINAKELANTGTLFGKVWTSNDDPTKSIHNLPVEDIPKGLFEVEDRMKSDIRETVGVNEAYTGQSVGSLTTSTGVNSLIERATLRDKDKMIQIDEFVSRISHLILCFILYQWEDKRPIPTTNPDGSVNYQTYEPIPKEVRDNLSWITKSDVYATAPTTQATRRQQVNQLLQWQGQFNFDPPIITPEEAIKWFDFDDKEEILRRMQKDRARMAADKALNLAQTITQVAQTIAEYKAKGVSDQQAQQTAMQFAQQLVDAQQQAERDGTRPRDAAKAPQGPRGTTGAQAMSNMVQGA